MLYTDAQSVIPNYRTLEECKVAGESYVSTLGNQYLRGYYTCIPGPR